MRCFWEGWEANTDYLARNGWDISVSCNQNHMTSQSGVEMILRHKSTNMNDPFYMMGQCQLSTYEIQMRANERDIVDLFRSMSFKMGCMPSNDVRIMHTDPAAFVQVKPLMSMPSMPNEMVSIRHLGIFEPVNAEADPQRDLIIKPDKIENILDQILNAQEKGIDDIRDREYQRGKVRQEHGRIITLVA